MKMSSQIFLPLTICVLTTITWLKVTWFNKCPLGSFYCHENVETLKCSHKWSDSMGMLPFWFGMFYHHDSNTRGRPWSRTPLLGGFGVLGLHPSWGKWSNWSSCWCWVAVRPPPPSSGAIRQNYLKAQWRECLICWEMSSFAEYVWTFSSCP